MTHHEFEQAAEADLDQAWYGELDGEQTAPCSELAGFCSALRVTTGDVEVVKHALTTSFSIVKLHGSTMLRNRQYQFEKKAFTTVVEAVGTANDNAKLV